MRHLTKILLTAGLAVAFVSLTLAQGPGRGMGGGFQLTEASLLNQKSVQEELKLTDAQKEKLTKIAEKFTADMKEATDKDARAKVNETHTADLAKVMEDLKPEQQKRLLQVYVQVSLNPPAPTGMKGGFARPANPLGVFANEHVQNALKFTGEQKELVKKTAEATSKDVAEISKGLFGKDVSKEDREEGMKKITEMNTKAVEKITTSFSDDQKKLWKDLPGEKFDGKIEFGGGTGRPKGKDNK